MKIFSKEVFVKSIHYDWVYYVLSVFAIIGLWSWAFGIFHRPKPYERLEIFVAAQIQDDSFCQEIEDEFGPEGLKLVESNQALPNDNAFQSKLQVVGYNASDLLILPESIFANLHFFEVFIEIDNTIKDNYLTGQENFYSHEGHDYGLLIRGGEKESWLDEYLNFDVNDNYYLFISGSSHNIGDKGIYETVDFDLALDVLSYLVR
ncbi:MAG: hypothetical protein GX816_02705 [Erysipelotrichia bacterium]|nr:hypothetical protein [Erysipelotrichia bacterium]